MPEFEVEVNPVNDDLADLCLMYWATNTDGSFTYSVKDVAERFDQPYSKVSKVVSEACVARSTSRICGECERGYTYRSRAAWASGARFAPARCSDCKDADERRKTEQVRQAQSDMRAAILQEYQVEDGGIQPRAEDLNLSEAIALAALFEDGEEVFPGLTSAIVDRTDRLSPTADHDFKALEALFTRGYVLIHPSSRVDSFVWDDGQLGSGHYPTLASYYLPGSGPLEGRLKNYLEGFSAVIRREDWPDHWTNQLFDFWQDVAVAECKAYLVYMLKRHGLDFVAGQRTDDVFRRALKWYSIGQIYYFIWRAARDSAAYFARESVPAKRAANSSISRISGDIDRAYAQGWKVSVYRRDSRLPISTLSHILFSRALQLDDPMTYSPMDLPARRSGLELDWANIDSDAFERLIYQLVFETDGYENVEWLMQVNAPDHGRDVSATRLRRDPLSGHSSQRVAIQCKHWLSKSIRDTDVSQAIVSLDYWQNPPFDVLVLATSGRFTVDAVSFIERHNSRGGRPGIEIWNDARLESLLNDRPHLIRGYELR